MSEYVSFNGKKLRKGYTTGTCATAATMAAMQMYLTKKAVHQIQLTTPSGVALTIPIHNCSFDRTSASCSVEKDGGDDQDATHGLHIYATVKELEEPIRQIVGGAGVGKVTMEGLAVPVGQPAINPTPMKMIHQAIDQIWPADKGIHVEISVPGGEEVAKGTYNPRLGIVGGISILGTSGIVTPMSEEGWKNSITIEMEQKYKLGHDGIILTPGNYGEDFIKEHTSLNDKYMVHMSNFVGYVLLEAMRIGFKRVLLVGHLGKFIKIAGGIFSTHSKDADARNEIMIANLALLGAPLELLQAVEQALTTEQQADIILEAGYGHVYQAIVDKIKERVLKLYKFKAPDIQVEAITFLNRSDVWVATKPMEQLEEEWA